MPLLLAPGGHTAAVEAAVLAGADGVYVGLRGFSRREGSGLTDAELARCLDFVHQKGRFFHLALNAVPASADLPGFQTALARWARRGVDGVILNDPGLIAWTRREIPGLAVYASVGLGALNREDVWFYADLGVAAVVLREAGAALSLPQGLPVGLEVFCDLAVEPLLTGRCSLSSYTQPPGAAAAVVKRGAPCRQPCRLKWEYEGPAVKQAGPPFPWRQDTMTDMAPYLRAGVTLFKIQGRRLAPHTVAGLVERCRRLLAEAEEKIVLGKD